jgi:hypothetical protein
MGSVVATLFEGDHHWGVGSLVNSLCKAGFEGDICVGHKGDLPPWCHSDAKTPEGWAVTPKVRLKLLKVDVEIHIARYKPTFLKALFDEDESVERVFYFDTDIVVKGHWEFFESWAAGGLAMVAHRFGLSHYHPHRRAWAQLGVQLGWQEVNRLEDYINSGFLGISRERESALDRWSEAINAVGNSGVDLARFQVLPSTHPWKLTDQAALNLVAMTTPYPLSIMDGSAMDFLPFGYLMSHAAGKGKPWRFRFIGSTLKGFPPNKAVYEWSAHIEHPMKLYSSFRVWRIRATLKACSLVSRFYRHPMSNYLPP